MSNISEVSEQQNHEHTKEHTLLGIKELQNQLGVSLATVNRYRKEQELYTEYEGFKVKVCREHFLQIQMRSIEARKRLKTTSQNKLDLLLEEVQGLKHAVEELKALISPKEPNTYKVLNISNISDIKEEYKAQENKEVKEGKRGRRRKDKIAIEAIEEP